MPFFLRSNDRGVVDPINTNRSQTIFLRNATNIAMVTHEQRITRTENVVTTDSDDFFTFSDFLTARR